MKVSDIRSLHLTHTTNSYTAADAYRIVLYGQMIQSAGELIDGYFTVGIEDFFREIQIALKEGSSTEPLVMFPYQRNNDVWIHSEGQ